MKIKKPRNALRRRRTRRLGFTEIHKPPQFAKVKIHEFRMPSVAGGGGGLVG